MTKEELIKEVGKVMEKKKDAEKAVDVVFKAIANALMKNDTVTLRSFGTFGIKQRPKRTGRNPRSGEAIAIPAHKVPFWKPSKNLKDSVN